jgi:hypothetical protein
MKARTIAVVLIIALAFGVGAVSADMHTRNFRTHLTGAEEATPVDTNAQGQAIFKFNEDLTELEFKLIVANIENVTAAHIHLGAPGVPGGVVLPLFVGGGPGNNVNGILAEGTLTAANLSGALAGATLERLRDEILAGNAYVNVHTTQNPPGEIRGQL